MDGTKVILKSPFFSEESLAMFSNLPKSLTANMQQNTASNWMGWFLNPGCLMAPCSSGCIYGDENVHPGVEGLVLETGQQRMVVWSLQGFMMLRTSQNLDELSMYLHETGLS